MNDASNTTWLRRLEDLLQGRHTITGDELDAGAQLVVTDPGGAEAFRAPLARHWRIDPSDDHVIWIRPILAGYPEDDGTPAFNLSLARRRALDYKTAHLDGDDVIFHLSSGQTARVQAADSAELTELQRWDVFYLMVLTEEENKALDALDGDSWYGRFG